jgi:hypothetical protein
MAASSNKMLSRWLDAALIDSVTADRIRSWEVEPDVRGAPHRFAAIEPSVITVDTRLLFAPV